MIVSHSSLFYRFCIDWYFVIFLCTFNLLHLEGQNSVEFWPRVLAILSAVGLMS